MISVEITNLERKLVYGVDFLKIVHDEVEQRSPHSNSSVQLASGVDFGCRVLSFIHLRTEKNDPIEEQINLDQIF